MEIQNELKAPSRRAYWRRVKWRKYLDMDGGSYTYNYLCEILRTDTIERSSYSVIVGNIAYSNDARGQWEVWCHGQTDWFMDYAAAETWLLQHSGLTVTEPETTDGSKPIETPKQLVPHLACLFSEEFDYSMYQWGGKNDGMILLHQKGGGGVYGWITSQSNDRYLAHFNCRLTDDYQPIAQFNSEVLAKAWLLYSVAKERAMSERYLMWAKSVSDLSTVDTDLRRVIDKEREEVEAAKHKGTHILELYNRGNQE